MQKLLADIRYFEALELPAPERESPYYVGDIYRKLDTQTNVFGARIASKCRELGVSIGRQDHLYILFTPALAPGAIRLLTYQTEVWNRFVAYGLSRKFNQETPAARRKSIEAATFEVLKNVAPKSARIITSIAEQHDALGAGMRILWKTTEYRDYKVEVTFNVVAPRRKMRLWLTVTEKASGRRGEIVVAELKPYTEARFFVHRIVRTGNTITLHPNTSSWGKLYTKGYRLPRRIRLDTVLTSPQRVPARAARLP